MPIGPASRLGHYEVTALIGEGGKVWRAHRTPLKRTALRYRRRILFCPRPEM
jgi:hypothetical protein